MRKVADFLLKALKFIWGLLKNNLLLKIMAVLFAIVLWSYVLSIVNPARAKTLPDVPISYTNIAQMDANDFAISKSLSNQLETVKVTVKVNQSYLKNVNNEIVTATVDLGKVTGPGECELQIQVTSVSAYCTVVDWSPKTVKLTIDQKVEKTIPVRLEVSGSAKDGYYAGNPVAMPDTIMLSGASVDVEKVSSAVCYIDISGLTEWDKKSMNVTLLDSEGASVDPGIFGSLPSVVVDMSILPKKTVKVDAVGSITGQESLAPGYYIPEGGITSDPAYVEIVGEASALAGISSVSLIPYPVDGKSSSVVVPLGYKLPEGVIVLGSDQAIVSVTIREAERTETFSGVNIDIRNVGRGMAAQLSQAEVDVTVTAGLSAMSRLRVYNVVPYVNLNGLGVGTYTVDILFEIPEGFAEDSFASRPAQVTVTITQG